MGSLPRRAWFAALLAAAGCSATKKPKRTTKKKPVTKSREPSEQAAVAWNRKHRPQGPQTFSNLLNADSWIEDLDKPDAKTRITAAKQLGNMGKSAQSALPKLEKLAQDKDAAVAKAAQQAIAAIRK